MWPSFRMRAISSHRPTRSTFRKLVCAIYRRSEVDTTSWGPIRRFGRHWETAFYSTMARYKIDATISPIGSGGCDYRNARRIITGVDQAARIAQYATTIEGILIDAIVR